MKTSRFAIAAAASVLATNAMAADLGGNCCADLEERVAELEATTARKGNRRVKLTVSGHVNEAVLFWDDGEERNAYVVTNENSRTRFRFVGDAKISADWSAGYLLEIGVRIANSAGVNQFVDDNTATNLSLDLRHSAWWIENAKYGRLWVGQTSMATDGITEINLSNAATPFGGPDMSNWGNSFFLRRDDGRLLVVAPFRGITWGNIAPSTGSTWNTGDGDRRNLVKYVSPTFWGFNWSWAWGEDDFWDTALRYAGEFNSIRVAAGIGYQAWSDGNARAVLPGAFFDPEAGQVVATGSQGDRGCANLSFARFGDFPVFGRGRDVNCDGVGLSGSIMHTPTGIYAAASYGFIDDYNRRELFADRVLEEFPDLAFTSTFRNLVRNGDERDDHWFVQVGVEKNWFGLGKTTVFVDYARFNQGIGVAGGDVANFGDVFIPFNNFDAVEGAFITSSEVDVWGVGFIQTIDAAAMDLYLGFRNFSGDARVLVIESELAEVEGETVIVDRRARREKLNLEDFQAVFAGGIIRF